jgi:hypothetical protein
MPSFQNSVLQIQTQHRCYTAVMLGGSQPLISGHPEYCPEPTLVAIAGSTWGGSMLKQRFVDRGMRLEFCYPKYSVPIVTSCVQEIRECLECPILDQDEPQLRFKTTERYLGCKQRIRSAVNDRIGIEP